MKLDVLRLGVACGIVWSAGVVLLAAWVALLGQGLPALETLSSIYVGYAATFTGAFVGALWGFADGFIGGVAVAWLYNLLPKRGSEQPDVGQEP